VLIRGECFRTVGLFDPDLRSVEDRDMWIRIAARFPVAKLETPLWWYRFHSGSMSTMARRMEENESKVLRKAFSHDSPLHHDWRLRLQAYSYAARSAAYMYDAAGMHFRGFTRMLRSFLLWPLPVPGRTAKARLERLRMLGVIGLRLARIRRAEPTM
jgi:hypothetical protein